MMNNFEKIEALNKKLVEAGFKPAKGTYLSVMYDLDRMDERRNKEYEKYEALIKD